MKGYLVRFSMIFLVFALALIPSVANASNGSFIGSLNKVDVVSSTVPSNGDVNPYGIVVVPVSMGKLVKGNILVSNFNNSNNLQGTGTTIVEITPKGQLKLFAQLDAAKLPGSCPGGVGLTTALVALHSGWVIVGSLPTTDGTSATAQAGCLIVLNAWGRPVETFSGGLINGPWDMTAAEGKDWAALFVTNVLNGTIVASPDTVNKGTVVRINLEIEKGEKPKVTSSTVIGSGFQERTDPAALVIGPTGVGLDEKGTLFVADTLSNRIAAIPNALNRMNTAGTGKTVAAGGAINGPLGLTIAPNGDILEANAGDGNLVEITPKGAQVAVKTVEAAGAGSLFGLTITSNNRGVYFVDDATNALSVLH